MLAVGKVTELKKNESGIGGVVTITGIKKSTSSEEYYQIRYNVSEKIWLKAVEDKAINKTVLVLGVDYDEKEDIVRKTCVFDGVFSE